MVYHTNSAVVEGLEYINGHRRKEVGEGKRVSWGGAQTKGKGREFKLTKNMLFHNDFYQFCLREKRKITEFFPDTTVFHD